MEQETKGIRYQSEHYKTVQNLMCKVNEQALMTEHQKQNATGVGGVDKTAYDEQAQENIRVWLKKRLTKPVSQTMKKLAAIIRGHANYCRRISW